MIKFGYHPKQLEMVSFKTRFLGANCGRRFGKTYGARGWLIQEIHRSRGISGWYITPTYSLAEEVFFSMLQMIDDDPDGLGSIIKSVNKKNYRIMLRTGKKIEFKSGDRPNNLRGSGIGALVIDECGYQRDELYKLVIRPAMADYEARAMFIGTPHFDNFFRQMYNEVKAGARTDMTFASFSTYDNPFIPKAEVDAMVEELKAYGEDIYRQEIMGEFISGASVFKNIEQCVTSDVTLEYCPDHHYTMGVDLAIERDNSVIAVVDNTQKALVCMEVMTGLKWVEQENIIAEIAARYNKPTTYIDATNQSKVADDLAAYYGLDIQPIRFSRANKTDYIHKLARYVGKKIIKIPVQSQHCDTTSLISEMSNFERAVTAFGNEKFKGHGRMKDDRVMALALAVSELGDYCIEREVTPDDSRKRAEFFRQYGVYEMPEKTTSRYSY